MAQLPGAVDNHGQGIAWLPSHILTELLCNGLLQVPMQLVPRPDALMGRERGRWGRKAEGARPGHLLPTPNIFPRLL